MTESELLIKDFRIMYDLSDENADTLSHFNADQLKEIFAGLICGAEEPVKFIMSFNAETFDANQIAEIIDGGKKGLNYREYVNPRYNYLQMKLIKDKEIIIGGGLNEISSCDHVQRSNRKIY